MLQRLNKTSIIYNFLTKESRSVSTKIKDKPPIKVVKRDSGKSFQKIILQEYLGLTYPQSVVFARKNKFIHEISDYKLISSIKVLQKSGLSNEDIIKNPQTLSYIDNTIEHNVGYLKEVGFKKIDASTLLKFRTIVKKPIYLLKLHDYISEDTDVIKSLCSYLTPNPTRYIKVNDLSDNNSVVEVHEEIFKRYFIWRLNTTVEETNRIFNIYDKFRFKSFKIISNMLKLLINEFGFDSAKLLQHGYLFDVNPKSVRKLMNTFPKLGNMDIKKALYGHPKLMTVPLVNIDKILYHIHSFGISDEAIGKCFDIFTLSPDSVLLRLNELKNVPEFEVLMKNPRIILLLFFQNKAKMRLEILRNLKIKCASLHMLCGPQYQFEKYMQEGVDKTNGTDGVYYLSMELGKSIKEIRDGLSVNPHWHHVPATAIRSSFLFLMNNGFSKNAIAGSLVILLFSKEQLEEALKEVNMKIEEDELKVTKTQQINLCLYVLEKRYHFSGNAIWSGNNIEETHLDNV